MQMRTLLFVLITTTACANVFEIEIDNLISTSRLKALSIITCNAALIFPQWRARRVGIFGIIMDFPLYVYGGCYGLKSIFANLILGGGEWSIGPYRPPLRWPEDNVIGNLLHMCMQYGFGILTRTGDGLKIVTCGRGMIDDDYDESKECPCTDIELIYDDDKNNIKLKTKKMHHNIPLSYYKDVVSDSMALMVILLPFCFYRSDMIVFYVWCATCVAIAIVLVLCIIQDTSELRKVLEVMPIVLKEKYSEIKTGCGMMYLKRERKTTQCRFQTRRDGTTKHRWITINTGALLATNSITRVLLLLIVVLLNAIKTLGVSNCSLRYGIISTAIQGITLTYTIKYVETSLLLGIISLTWLGHTILRTGLIRKDDRPKRIITGITDDFARLIVGTCVRTLIARSITESRI